MNPLVQFKEIGEAFVDAYYKMFDTNRPALSTLYGEESLMSFEGSQVRGSTSIVEKLVTLPFQNISHQLTTVDCQPTLDGTGIVVFVVGQLKTDEDKPHGFSQVFLLKFVDNSCYIANDIFRLSLHHSA